MAFTARPWELRSIYSVDFFDSLGSNIRFDVRSSEIMRVLPVVTNAINEEWITDKIRFSYDGLKRQRLSKAMIRVSSVLTPVSLEILHENFWLKYIYQLNSKPIRKALGLRGNFSGFRDNSYVQSMVITMV